MPDMISLERDFILGNMKVFNEYDRSSFLTNAKMSLGHAASNIGFDIRANYYSDFLSQALSNIENFDLDIFTINDFFTSIANAGRLDTTKCMIRDLTYPDNIALKPQYLISAAESIRKTVGKFSDGSLGMDRIRQLYETVDAWGTSLKKNIVTSNLDVYATPKMMLKDISLPTVPCNSDYIKDVMIPFINEIKIRKKAVTIEINQVIDMMGKSFDILKPLYDSVYSDKMIDIDNPETRNSALNQRSLLMNFCYNYFRAFFDAVSFITFAAIRKARILELKLLAIQDAYNILSREFSDMKNVVESGFYKGTMEPVFPEKLAEDMMASGANDKFELFAKDLMDYHKGNLSINVHIPLDVGDDMDGFIEANIMNNTYDNGAYDTIKNIYGEIEQGLDILDAGSDDELMVFNELIDRTPFTSPLDSRFGNSMEKLGENPKYDNEYYSLLAEINSYPGNTKEIAELINRVCTKLNDLSVKLKTRNGSEENYSESINELRNFIEKLREEFKALTTLVCDKLYNRLVTISNKAEALSHQNIECDLDPDDNTDFMEMALEGEIDDIDALNDIHMKALVREYYALKEYMERGVRIIYEADGAQPSVTPTVTNTQTGQTGQQASSVKGKVTAEKKQKLSESIMSLFTNMIEKFNAIINRQKVKNEKWLAANKERFASRSYANISIDILPYDKAPSSNNIVDNLDNVAKAVAGMTPQTLTTINSYEDMKKKLLPFVPNINKVTGTGEEGETVRKYYKTGSQKYATVTYANGAIKELVMNTMIPYCETYTSNFSKNITSKIDAIKNQMNNVINSYTVNESTYDPINDEIHSMYMEADTPGQPAPAGGNGTTGTPPAGGTQPQVQNNQQTQQTPTDQKGQPTNANTDEKAKHTGGLGDKAEWMKTCCLMYTGAVLNAIRDRYKDFLDVLAKLVPPSKETADTTQPAGKGKKGKGKKGKAQEQTGATPENPDIGQASTTNDNAQA